MHEQKYMYIKDETNENIHVYTDMYIQARTVMHLFDLCHAYLWLWSPATSSVMEATSDRAIAVQSIVGGVVGGGR